MTDVQCVSIIGTISVWGFTITFLLALIADRMEAAWKEQRRTATDGQGARD